MTSNEIHFYRFRHLFKGDEHIGKYDSATRTVRLREEFSGLKDEARAYMIRCQGIHPAAVLVGAEALAAAPAPRNFPPEIADQFSKVFGVRTPVAVEYAQEHFTKAEFERCYGSAPAYTGPKQAPEPEPVPAPPAAEASAETKRQPRAKKITPEPETE